MQEINLTLTTEETNLVLEALGQLPFVRVYALIDKLQQQARDQLRGAATRPGPAPVPGGDGQ